MNTTRTLLALAFLQIALLPVTWRKPADSPRGAVDVVETSADDIDAVTIRTSGESGTSVTLERDGEEWIVASSDDAPADTDRVESLLDDLKSLTRDPEPIASQRVSHAALGVGDTDFGRRIEVRADGATTTITLGRSNTGGVNLRLDDDPAVYAARGAALHDFATSASTYIAEEPEPEANGGSGDAAVGGEGVVPIGTGVSP